MFLAEYWLWSTDGLHPRLSLPVSSIKGCCIEFIWQVSSRFSEKFRAFATLGAVSLLLSVNHLSFFSPSRPRPLLSPFPQDSLSPSLTLVTSVSLTAEIKPLLLLPLGFRSYSRKKSSCTHCKIYIFLKLKKEPSPKHVYYLKWVNNNHW